MKPHRATVLRLAATLCAAAVVATACSGGGASEDASSESTTTGAQREATTGGDAVAAPDAKALLAALGRAGDFRWSVTYRVDGVRDVESLVQTWVPPVMTSETTGRDGSGNDEAARIVYDERSGALKTCGVGEQAEVCEEEKAGSVRPRLRAFSNLAPGALRRNIEKTAVRPDARFATRTIAERRADCVTAPSADGSGITEACVDDESGLVLLLKGFVDNIVFDLLAVEASVSTTQPAER